MTQLTDNDPMPFGKYGKESRDPRNMAQVPADYLFWLWTNGLREKTLTSNVADYIQRNLSSLQMEYPDGIWD